MMTLNYLKSMKTGFSDFSAAGGGFRIDCDHISIVNCTKNTGNRPGQPEYKFFSA